MKYGILITDRAREELTAILRYIAQDSQSVETALAVEDRIEKRVRLLAESPHMGSIPRLASLRRRGYRTLIADRYLIFYKCDEMRRQVTIYHMVDSRRDLRFLV